MDWIYDESFCFCCPDFADVFVRCQTFQGLEATPIIVGVQKISEMAFELLVAVVVVALNSRFFDCSVYALDLTIGPGMLDLGESVLNAMFIANPVKDLAANHLRHKDRTSDHYRFEAEKASFFCNLG